MQNAQQLEEDAQWAEAAAQYVLLLKDEPTPAIYERVAWCFSRAGRYEDAIKYLRILHELKPNSAKWPYMIGYQYYCQKAWPQAIEWFEKALDKFSEYFIVKYRLAYALVQSAGNYKQLTKAEYWKALGHLKDCHRLWEAFNDNKKQRERQTYFNINFLHGKVLMNLPNYRNEAIKLFQAALEIKPKDEFTKYNLAKTYYLDGEYRKAKKYIPESNHYYIVELSAYIDAKLGEYEKTISGINNLLHKRKKDYLYRFLAEVYLLMNDFKEAYKPAQRAITLGRSNHKNYFTLAKVYYQLGLFNKAIENIDKAISLKKEKYGTLYNDCEALREEVLLKLHPDYHDDEKVIEELQKITLQKTERGTICRYNQERGFGFISCSPRNIFFHVSNCKYKDISVGDVVKYTITTSDKGVMAIDLTKIE